MDELVRYLKALVFLQIDASVGRTTKPELLLARSGFRAKEIAEILGRTEAAVAKAISRAKSAAKQEISLDE